MRLNIVLDPARLRRWHVRLVGRLAQRPGAQVGVQWGATGEKLPNALALLFALERLIHGLPSDDLVAAAEADELDQYSTVNATPDLVIDFTGAATRLGERKWHVTFDGIANESAALAALTQGRTPIVGVVDASTGAEIITGHPGTETGGVLLLAFQDVLTRTATLVVGALDGAGARQFAETPRTAALTAQALTRFAIKSLARTLVGRLYHLCYHAPHWRVGWRRIDGDGVVEQQSLGPGRWHDLPDDRRRFYADPFPLVHGGRSFLFVEDFAHRLGRGVISVVEFDQTGPIGTPRPVLDTNSHLSYPFVFEHRCETWMVPESCAAQSVDLYRAVEFPDRWVKEATLVAGVAASDATLFEHDGRWWMLATVRDGGGAYSDALHVWSARDLLGPWEPHARNPVLVDIATARPAGHVVRQNGRLVRPFQNCRDGYGAALGLAEITQLDDEGFAQRVDVVLRPGTSWPGRRVHTLNRAGQLECIDGSAFARRFF